MGNGVRDTVKLTEVDGFDLELDAEGILLFFRYADRPGVVGLIGTALGAAGSTSPACRCRGVRSVVTL